MIWKKLARTSWARNMICAVLAVSVLLSMCLPALQRQRLQPENHLSGAQMQDITVLQAGEAESLTNYAGSISSEAEGSGQNGNVPGKEGDALPEDAQQQEDVAPEQKEENVQGQPRPDEKPKDPLSDAAVEPVPSESEDSAEQTGDQDQEAGSDGEEGLQEGDQGDEGGEEMPLEIGLVMTWYKYGTQARTIVCKSGEQVGKRILTAQLHDSRLRYSFDLAGQDARNARITSVTCAVGNGVHCDVGQSGDVAVSVPADPGYQNIVFRVEAEGEKQNDEGEWVRQELSFTYVIRCENGKDLELELSWEKEDGYSSVICAANGSASREIKSVQLKDGAFRYSTRLLGQLAEASRLIAGEYRSASGEYGTLSPDGGTLTMKVADGSDSETYYLSFTAIMVQQDDEGDMVEETVTYTITIVYKNTLDLRLAFTWFERGITRRDLVCDLNKSISDRVKTNELSAGALRYEMKLTGESAKDARIKAIALQHNGGSQSAAESGSVPVSIDSGDTSATYAFTVTVEIGEQTATFTVTLRLSGDISLQMNYTIVEEGMPLPQQIVCENKRTVTAETVYDDQLTEGALTYSLSLLGEDAEGVVITGVKCYQSGSMKTRNLAESGTVQLLLDGKKTGENTFTVTARDSGGQTYTFTINIPYKHRGDELVKIAINLTDGMEVTNGESVNLTVRAWTEDENGKRVSTIRATGTDTILTVTLDGRDIPYISASGDSQEYTLLPENPETGDSNEHTLRIYAQDEFGNYGETVITLIGIRSQKGQPIGTAMVYVDLTVLGLGIRGPVAYTILSGESAAYMTAKVLWGEDFGEPFGSAEHTLGYAGGRTGGTYETGFYLASLYTGGSTGAQALTGQRWENFGSTEEEILAYIDSRFGKGTGLATLWRCIYRNGLTLSTESPGAIGEFDYTGGSGWLYSVGGGSYYPGQSMSDYYLRDGDVLTYRYTLAQGWDIGGGTDNYGNTVGYCVSAANGNFAISHQMESVPTETGGTAYVCRCCGLREDCAHADAVSRDQGDGTHRIYCEACGEWVGDAQEHSWSPDEAADSHICTECGFSAGHDWREIADTATCLAPGIRTDQCVICWETREQESAVSGHKTDETWYYNDQGHYQKCSACQQEMGQGEHEFRFDGVDDWICQVCSVGHDWDLEHPVEKISGDCAGSVYHCEICGVDLYGPGDGVSHRFENGWCAVPGCGVKDPNAAPEEEAPGGETPTEPPAEQPADPPAQVQTPPAEEGGAGESETS